MKRLRLLSLILWLQRTKQRVKVLPLVGGKTFGLLWWSLSSDQPEEVSRKTVAEILRPAQSASSSAQEPILSVNYENGMPISAYLRFVGSDGRPVFRIYYSNEAIETVFSHLGRCPDVETRLLVAEMLAHSVSLV